MLTEAGSEFSPADMYSSLCIGTRLIRLTVSFTQWREAANSLMLSYSVYSQDDNCANGFSTKAAQKGNLWQSNPHWIRFSLK